MGFGLSKLVAAITAPGNLLLLLLALGFALWWRGRRAGRWLALAGLSGFAVIAVTPLSTWLLLPLEERFAPMDPAALADVDGIIVLGGALMPIGSREHGAPQLTRDAERLTVLPGLLRRLPDAQVVFTGGSGDPRRPDEREAPFVKDQLVDWGIAPDRILLEDASRNTWENAVNSRPLLSAGKRWLLVTSAAHMPRAMGVFCMVAPEITFIAYPVGYNANRSETASFGLNLSDNLVRMENAAYEWRGLLAYWLGGRIPTLFPAP